VPRLGHHFHLAQYLFQGSAFPSSIPTCDFAERAVQGQHQICPIRQGRSRLTAARPTPRLAASFPRGRAYQRWQRFAPSPNPGTRPPRSAITFCHRAGQFNSQHIAVSYTGRNVRAKTRPAKLGGRVVRTCEDHAVGWPRAASMANDGPLNTEIVAVTPFAPSICRNHFGYPGVRRQFKPFAH